MGEPTLSQVADFITDCISQCEADGYQQNESLDGFVEPDDIKLRGRSVYLRYGSKWYRATVNPARSGPDQEASE